MPQHKSCKKRMKTSAEARLRNRALRSNLKGAFKEFQGLTNKAEAEKRLNDIYSIIDKALKGKIIHRNKAARAKSRMTAFARSLAN